MDQQIRIGVIFGGKSPEHEISVITAMQVLKNIDKKYEAVPIYVSKEGEFFSGIALGSIDSYKNFPQLAPKVQFHTDSKLKGIRLSAPSRFRRSQVLRLDFILPCFHGALGENGGFQGLFEVLGIPYAGPGIIAGGAGMDKVVMKQLFENVGLPITKWTHFYRNSWVENESKLTEEIERKISYPAFVKPANSGSSIGISKVKNAKELKNAIEVASMFDKKIIVEESFEGREINISVIGNSGGELKHSVCEEVLPSKDLLSYDDKYKSEGKQSGMASAKRIVPAALKEDIRKKVEEYAKLAYRTLDCSGLARIDFIVNEENGSVVILEVNTIPGSLAFYLWEKSGLTFTELLNRLIELGFEKFEENKKSTTSFSTNILQNFKASGKTGKI